MTLLGVTSIPSTYRVPSFWDVPLFSSHKGGSKDVKQSLISATWTLQLVAPPPLLPAAILRRTMAAIEPVKIWRR